MHVKERECKRENERFRDRVGTEVGKDRGWDFSRVR